MSYTKRYLVTNRKNEIMTPLKERFETDQVKSAKSPSFLTLDGDKGAKAFAAALAAKYPGKSFYVSEVLAGVKAGGGACWGDATTPETDADNE